MKCQVVEHASGPSVPPRYSSSGAYRGSGPVPTVGGGGIENVGYEGFEVDEDDEEAEDVGMVRAVSSSRCVVYTAC